MREGARKFTMDSEHDMVKPVNRMKAQISRGINTLVLKTSERIEDFAW